MSASIVPNYALNMQAIGNLALPGAEISAFDPASDRLYMTSNLGITIIDLSNPAAPVAVSTFNLQGAPYGAVSTDVSSVAIKNGIVAMAVQNPNKNANGQVVFLDAATGNFLGKVTVGAHPDMLTFTPDGTKVLVANEAEYLNNDGGPGTGDGSVSIIDISGGVASATVQTAGFGGFDAAALRAEGVRVAVGQTAARDLEPEYIAISPDGTTALVTLQEANAVAILDIATATFTDIKSLGLKDFSTLLADFSDRDDAAGTGNALKLETGNPVFGVYMPDAIASFSSGGQTYYVIANEGDDRNDFVNPNEVVSLSSNSYNLDDATFPNEATLKLNSELGRLNVINTPGLNGDTDNDGDIDQILTLGGRSFSILDADGDMVYDSGDMIERIVAKMVQDGTFPLSVFDGRSDNKGPEPEGVTIGEIDGKTYAFIGLERANQSLVFDLTNPLAPVYVGPASRTGDISPEGTLFISAADSPTGTPLYVQSNEGADGVNASVTVFEAKPTFTLQILHGSDFEAGLLAVDRAKNFAAITDALEDTYTNSITLSSGDNFIPGPFLAAGTDAAVRNAFRAYWEQELGLAPGTLVNLNNDQFARVDLAILNEIGIQASVLGNHEFDLGPNSVAQAIDMVAPATSGSFNFTGAARVTNIGAQFPYLSANINFAPESTLSGLFTATRRDAASYATTAADLVNDATVTAEAADQQISPWTTITENGEIIGVLGATTQILRSISTTGNLTMVNDADGIDDNDMTELAGILQPYVDQMTAAGINKIILLSHLQQYQFELELATKLSGVDIIIAGGSHQVFADGTDTLRPGDTAAQGYPEFRTGADGKTVAVVNTGGEYSYVGRLVVTFDHQGNIIPASVDPAVSGAYATTDAVVDQVAGDGDGVLSQAEQDAIFADGTRGGEVKQLTDAVGAVINAKDGVLVGYTDVFLEGRRNEVRSEETNFGNLTADANRWAASLATGEVIQVGLKNGGGIRAEIGVVAGQPIPSELPPQANPAAGKPTGAISQLDVENSLRFNNGISVVSFTASNLDKLIENTIRTAGPGLTPGSFPQISGLNFSWDKDLAAGSRVQNMALVNDAGQVLDIIVENGALVGDASRLIRVALLNFNLDGGANGGDNWLLNLDDQDLVTAGVQRFTNRVNLFDPLVATPGFATAGREQKIFSDYMTTFFGTPAAAFDIADTAPALDGRIQNLDVRADTVLLETIAGTAVSESISGTAGYDSITGADGNDTVTGLGGRDTIDLGAGRDSADGGLGDDSIGGGGSADTVRGGEGSDTLDGGAGNDRVHGDAGDDMLFGGDNNDLLDGGDGNDMLDGGRGSDVVTGGAGNDTLVGGALGDTVSGGDGLDVFRYLVESESFDSSPSRLDVIEDFVRGEDLIDLAFDANRPLAGMQDFVFTAGSFASNQPGRVRVETVVDGVMVYANTDNDSAAEFALMVRGVTTLDATDFIL